MTQLEALGIPVWVGDATTTFEETYAQIEQLGAVTGHVGEAAELVGQMATDIEAIIASMPAMEVPLTVFHELDDTGYTVTSSTFIGHVYGQLGLQNIADAAGGDYPQLNAETIIAANPDLIFLADTKCCGREPGDGQRPRRVGRHHRRGQRKRVRHGRRHRVPLGAAGGRVRAAGDRCRPSRRLAPAGG